MQGMQQKFLIICLKLWVITHLQQQWMLMDHVCHAAANFKHRTDLSEVLRPYWGLTNFADVRVSFPQDGSGS